MSAVAFTPIRVNTLSEDAEGRLVMWQGALVGVLVRLDAPEQGDAVGGWSLEAGFGPLEFLRPEPFADLEQARGFVERTAETAA